MKALTYNYGSFVSFKYSYFQYFYTYSSTSSALDVYFVQNNITDFTTVKEFIHKDVTLNAATIDDNGTPSNNVKTTAFDNFKVIRVYEVPVNTEPAPINWPLDTTEGNITIAAIVIGGLLLIGSASFALYKCCKSAGYAR